ncbi:hypothetical protein [Leucobacter coleopterorum]|uniref:hypothetical protein n=1 Tax=Leucobacter coleopterorum TaxID=2714933 RepID=UPI001FCB4CFD|nr:hypothetical protein [Leucobacter coleopterorum]
MTLQLTNNLLRERLLAAAAVVGVPLTISDDTEWRVTRDGIQVGLGYYAVCGHSDQEAVALAILQLWESVRFRQTAPDRARRRDSIAQQSPGLEPLLDAVLRLQAASELLSALPALRDDLAAAATRSLPDTLLEWPRHLQWIGLLLNIGLARQPGLGVAPEVTEEWRALTQLGGSGTDPLRRVLAPDPERTPLQRFERALALLLPAYERLNLIDAAERGLADTAEAGATDDTAEGIEGAAGGDSAEAQQGEGESHSDSETSAPDPATERARRGEGQERSEGSDLFAAEQAGFVTTFLSTPMPSQTALLEANIELSSDAQASAGSETVQPSGGRPGSSQSARRESDYRERASELAEAIERMRDVWSQVIVQRIAHRAAPDRLPQQDGDTLHPEALAGVIADVHAGVPNPHAFVRRRARPRRTRRSGSTDYVLLIDRSASMQGPVADAAADAALIMLEALAGAERDIAFAESTAGISLDLDIRTSLIVFDAVAETVKPLSRGLDDAVRRRMVAAIHSTRDPQTTRPPSLRQRSSWGLADPEPATPPPATASSAAAS